MASFRSAACRRTTSPAGGLEPAAAPVAGAVPDAGAGVPEPEGGVTPESPAGRGALDAGAVEVSVLSLRFRLPKTKRRRTLVGAAGALLSAAFLDGSAFLDLAVFPRRTVSVFFFATAFLLAISDQTFPLDGSSAARGWWSGPVPLPSPERRQKYKSSRSVRRIEPRSAPESAELREPRRSPIRALLCNRGLGFSPSGTLSRPRGRHTI